MFDGFDALPAVSVPASLQTYAEKRQFFMDTLVSLPTDYFPCDSVGARALRYEIEARAHLCRWRLTHTPCDPTPLGNEWPSDSVSALDDVPHYISERPNLRDAGFEDAVSGHTTANDRSVIAKNGRAVRFWEYLYLSGAAKAHGREFVIEPVDGEVIARVSPRIFSQNGALITPLSSKPHLCYYIRITRVLDGASCYKVGITSTSVAFRFLREEGLSIDVLASWSFPDRKSAASLEAETLAKNTAYLMGDSAQSFLKFGGWTECFSEDVLTLSGPSVACLKFAA